MSTTRNRTAVRPSTTPAQRLRSSCAAVRVSFTWLGMRKTLTPQQKAEAAESFGAKGQYLSAGKKLLDTKHPSFKAVTAVRGKVLALWKGLTLPYPEPGIRLIRQSEVEQFDQQMKLRQGELAEAVQQLDRRFSELKSSARERLGRLFDASDYPSTLEGWFKVEWDFPSVEPPEYLKDLNQEIFEQERARAAARFDDAVRLAESAFLEEFAKLVSHICERTSGDKKVFRDSMVENLVEFFDRFRKLNVQSNEDLDALVERAQQIVRGIEPDALRSNQRLRQSIAQQLSGVQQTLEGMLVDRPRRRILRTPVTQLAAEGA